MRINDSALRHFAATHAADRKGKLSYQAPKDSTKTKHFKLIGNLLFHYKHDKSLTSDEASAANDIESVGMLVIERCSVQSVGERGQLARMFCIIFEGEGVKKHYFTASTVGDCEGWITALTIAGYPHMRAELLRLRQEIKARSGADPWDGIQKKVLGMMHQNRTISQRSLTSRYKTELPAEPTRKAPAVPARGKSKAKGGSTFYTESSLPLSLQSKPHRHTVPRGKDRLPEERKSHFFKELDVVRAPGNARLQDKGPMVVSSGVDELRRKAMTMGRPKHVSNPSPNPTPETNSIPNPTPGTNRTPTSHSTGPVFQAARPEPHQDVLNSSAQGQRPLPLHDMDSMTRTHRSAVYDHIPGLDLLDLSDGQNSSKSENRISDCAPRAAPLTAWPPAACSGSGTTQTGLFEPPRNPRSSIHGQMTPLIPCASGPVTNHDGHNDQHKTAHQQHNRNTAGVWAASTNGISQHTTPGQPPLLVPPRANQSQRSAQILDPFDLSFLEDGSKTSNAAAAPVSNASSNPFNNWEKF